MVRTRTIVFEAARLWLWRPERDFISFLEDGSLVFADPDAVDLRHRRDESIEAIQVKCNTHPCAVTGVVRDDHG